MGQRTMLRFQLMVLLPVLWKTVSSWSLRNPSHLTSRRQQILDTIAIVTSASVVSGSLCPPDAAAIDELPSFVRPYTKLAPLGKAESMEKTTGLSLEDLAARLQQDLTQGASRSGGGYFVTGDLSTDIFRDDCVFVDPTNEVNSLSRYQKALRILFDPNASVVEIVRPLAIDPEKRTITTTIRSRGYLQFPWRPHVSSYESDVVYSVDKEGLIERQEQTWSKSASQALKETFTPSLFSPPPKSNAPKPPNEPAAVTQLFDKINGRRQFEYSPKERIEIDQLVDDIANSQYAWNAEELPGKWMLVYLQPGPEGGGIDRRIPFPEFAFNDSYQIFTSDSVVNIGELFGPWLEVQVGGSLREAVPGSTGTPKRFEAGIEGGKLCLQQTICAPLPIEGQGLFDGVYLGTWLRIGQNLNGGGARVVQVRMG